MLSITAKMYMAHISSMLYVILRVKNMISFTIVF